MVQHFSYPRLCSDLDSMGFYLIHVGALYVHG